MGAERKPVRGFSEQFATLGGPIDPDLERSIIENRPLGRTDVTDVAAIEGERRLADFDNGYEAGRRDTLAHIDALAEAVGRLPAWMPANDMPPEMDRDYWEWVVSRAAVLRLIRGHPALAILRGSE